MDNDTGAVILAVILAAAVFLLAVFKLAEFFGWYSQEKRYILTEIRRAGNKNEYLYWRRELSYLYLCLIPFVNKRNVPNVYRFFFRRPKHVKEKQTDVIMHILAPSVIGIAVCAVCLCTASWAWFTASISAGTTAIKTPEKYQLAVSVTDGNNQTAAVASGEYQLLKGTYTVRLSAVGTAGAAGYCKVEAGGKTYYTAQIAAGSEFCFKITANSTVLVNITPGWGSRVRNTDGTEITQSDKIAQNDEINVSGTGVFSEQAHNEEEQSAESGETEAPEPRENASDTAAEKENTEKTEATTESFAGER